MSVNTERAILVDGPPSYDGQEIDICPGIVTIVVPFDHKWHRTTETIEGLTVFLYAERAVDPVAECTCRGGPHGGYTCPGCR